MNTVADKLMKLVQTKSDIRQALLDKGFNVPDTMPFSGYADLIRRFPCNAKDFPDIPGMIARWSAKGLTNEDMSTNPVWKDLTGNGHDFQMKNFGWAEMSGVGGYNQNFNRWSYTNLHNATETHTSNKIELNVIDAGNRTGNIYSTLFPVGYIFDFNIKVTGLKDPCFILVSKGTTESIIKITNDGIYNIKATVDESWDQRRIYFIINNSGGSLFDGLVIEQLPLYPGALVFDGVDDYGICDNFPILTKEKGYTVVALRRWLVLKPTGYYTLISNSNQRQEGAFNAEDFKMQAKGTFSWGNYTQNLNKTNASFMFQTSTSYNGGTIRGEAVEKGNDFLQVCKIGSFCSNMAIWEICILDHDATEEELQKIQDYYKQEYPWLFPDQAWTVVGKTNEDEDRATIANITGNGNDLVLYNLGFAEGSGYNEEGEYAGYLVTDGVDDRVVSRSFTLNKDWTIVGNWKMLQPEANKSSGIVKQNSLFIYNHVDGLNISINDAWNFFKLKDIRSVNAICSDGRIYLNDWTEIIDSKQQTVNESVGALVIGILGNVYTSLAFKNLGIYNNQLLSKDDCIKAYNYLQTLKS